MDILADKAQATAQYRFYLIVLRKIRDVAAVEKEERLNAKSSGLIAEEREQTVASQDVRTQNQNFNAFYGWTLTLRELLWSHLAGRVRRDIVPVNSRTSIAIDRVGCMK